MSGQDGMLKISFIVPVYNTEFYLARCLDSLLQTSVSFEIIVVDDGSTDQSAQVLRSYQSSYSMIDVISQSNQGQSAARNVGLKAARGEFILFVDSDDWIAVDSLCQMITIMQTENLDILACNGSEYRGGKVRSIRRHPQQQSHVMAGHELLVFMLKNNNYLPVIWLNLYRRVFLLGKGLFLNPELKISEDGEYSMRVFLAAARVKYVNICFYQYQIRQNSSSQTNANPYQPYAIKSMHLSYALLQDKQLTDVKVLVHEVLNAYFQIARCTAKLSEETLLYKQLMQMLYEPDTFKLVEKNLTSFKRRLYFFFIKMDFTYYKWIKKVF